MAEKIYNAYYQSIDLTIEQEACLKYTGNRTLMVKGYAGSGKSVVLMAIAQKHLRTYGPTAKNKVAIFTFQNTLVSSTRELLKVNGDRESGVAVYTVNSYFKQIYDELVKRKLAPRRHYPMTKFDRDKQLSSIRLVQTQHQTKYGKHRFHDIPADFWLEEFNWMKDMNIGKDDLDVYIQLKRVGRGSKYRFSQTDYGTAFQLYALYLQNQETSGLGDWADQPMFLARHPNLIPDEFKFDHILIDEAQDLSLAQMTALLHLYRDGGNMHIAMDANQKIHGKYWTPKLLGIEATTKKLTTSMRTTKQIDALAESVRSKNDPRLDEDDRSLRAIPERDGELPKLVCLQNQAAERKYVLNTVKTYLASKPGATIGIIAAKNKQIDLYSEWLSSDGIPHEQIRKDSTFSMANPGVKVASAYSAKGLEFNIVIIPMFAEGYFPYKHETDDEEEYEQFLTKMRNLVYVSMTRAKNILTITWWGRGGSRFIQEMDENLYVSEGGPFIINPLPLLKKKRELTAPPQNDTTPTASYRPTPAAPPSTQVASPTSAESNLVQYLKSKGCEVHDKRYNNGALWLVGGKELDPIVKETRKLYGAMWTFSQKGGNASGHRPAWFTRSAR